MPRSRKTAKPQRSAAQIHLLLAIMLGLVLTAGIGRGLVAARAWWLSRNAPRVAASTPLGVAPSPPVVAPTPPVAVVDP